MNIAAIHSPALQEIQKDIAELRGTGTAASSEGGFASFLQKSMGDVNELLNHADKKSVELASGKSENLHDAMIAFEKAETALKLMVQARNKAIEAYHEIMRMQV